MHAWFITHQLLPHVTAKSVYTAPVFVTPAAEYACMHVCMHMWVMTAQYIHAHVGMYWTQ